MSYRNITVENKKYQYTIGKKFTKIKNFGIFENSKIGNQVVTFSGNGEPRPLEGYFVVTPSVVKAVILNQNLPLIFYTRDANGNPSTTSYLMVDPFKAEIYEKIIYLAASYQSYIDLLDEI